MQNASRQRYRLKVICAGRPIFLIFCACLAASSGGGTALNVTPALERRAEAANASVVGKTTIIAGGTDSRGPRPVRNLLISE
jgi:hypothetical protein